MKKLIAIAAGLAILSGCKNNNEPEVAAEPAPGIPPPASITYNVVATYPHDTTSYTQGLIWVNNSLYEGTGVEGQSHLMKVDIASGKANKKIALANDVFGEGIALLNDKIYQLTWQTHKVFVYDAATFKKLQEFDWAYEGWGLTHNGKELIVSTGSSQLYFVDPAGFKITRTLEVTDNNGPVGNLNELEMIEGSIYANIYLTDYIIRIDPANGHITGRMDLSRILDKSGKPYNPQSIDVLNGIAYDSAKKAMYITGKNWPALFELKLN